MRSTRRDVLKSLMKWLDVLLQLPVRKTEKDVCAPGAMQDTPIFCPRDCSSAMGVCLDGIGLPDGLIVLFLDVDALCEV